MIWEQRRPARSDEDRMADRFTRRETPAQRKRRIARKALDPITARALFLALGSNQPALTVKRSH